VQIVYFMTGRFGGYGSFVNVEKGKAEYEILAAVKDVPAETFKLIAFLPGCQIEIRDTRVQSPRSTMQLACVPLAQIRLRGQVTPSPKIHPGDRIEINYLAEWDFDFFGISDGPVTTFHIAEASLDANGLFDFSVPDFFAQPGLSQGEFQFLLQEDKPGGSRTDLHPSDDAGLFRGLRVEAIYPSIIRFAAE
jgi:hypothetical protein